MKAATVTDYDRVPELREAEPPRPADGQEVVDVELAGLNPIDLAIASGRFDAGAPGLPYVTGTEGIGTDRSGRRVWFDGALHPHGSIAGKTLIREGGGIEVPEEIESSQALAFGVAGLAAWLGLGWRGELTAGETVVVLGASGAVGQVAVQAAKLLGAGRVVAVARSVDGRRRAGELGADSVLGIGEGLAEDLKGACGDGADLVLDCLWGEPALAAIGALKGGGRLVQVGNSASPKVDLPAGPLRGGLVSILGHRNFWAPEKARRDAFHRMCGHSLSGELRIEVEVTSIDEIGDTWRRQQASPGLKLVIDPA